MQNQRAFDRTFSFEFFPPKTPEGVARLRATREQLAQLKPKFFLESHWQVVTCTPE